MLSEEQVRAKMRDIEMQLVAVQQQCPHPFNQRAREERDCDYLVTCGVCGETWLEDKKRVAYCNDEYMHYRMFS